MGSWGLVLWARWAPRMTGHCSPRWPHKHTPWTHRQCCSVSAVLTSSSAFLPCSQRRQGEQPPGVPQRCGMPRWSPAASSCPLCPCYCSCHQPSWGGGTAPPLPSHLTRVCSPVFCLLSTFTPVSCVAPVCLPAGPRGCKRPSCPFGPEESRPFVSLRVILTPLQLL